MLGYCSQPREIHAADSQLRLDQQIKADCCAGWQGGRAALADGHKRLGEQGKSRAGLERIPKELPGTEYAKRAAAGVGRHQGAR